jgi:gliding motility associated protien GldN
MKKLAKTMLMLCYIFAINTLVAQGVKDPKDTTIKRHIFFKDGVEDEDDSIKPWEIPYTYLRQADVMWKKRLWRIIDLREKINLPLYYPLTPNAERESVFDVLKDALKKGEITAYQFSPDLDDCFRVPLTKTEVSNMLSRSDTVTDENGNPTLVRNDVGSADIRQYMLKEDWFFDKQRSMMMVRVIGLSPMKIVINANTGEEDPGIPPAPMCWLYFPELRPLFIKTLIFNEENIAQCRTLDDIFWKRHFSSYIFQESNVYNRPISAYTNGIDAQLESERIKKKMFDIEHDMWQY